MTPDPAPAPPLLRQLRRHGIDIPAVPETRDVLLTRVHDAWRPGRLDDVCSIATALTTHPIEPIPGRILRTGLTTALISGENPALPRHQHPVTGQRPLRRCALAPFDHSDCAQWTYRAHSAWLTWAWARIPATTVGTLVDALFTGCPDYGRELLTHAREPTSPKPHTTTGMSTPHPSAR